MEMLSEEPRCLLPLLLCVGKKLGKRLSGRLFKEKRLLLLFRGVVVRNWGSLLRYRHSLLVRDTHR